MSQSCLEFDPKALFRSDLEDLLIAPVPDAVPERLKRWPQHETGEPVRVLVIDDDPVDREAVRRALEESNLAFELAEAASAGAGIQVLGERTFDCVLLDYRFPTGGAFELFSEVLSQTCDSRPPVVMLTGAGDERIASRAIKRGAQDYLSKADLTPFNLRRTVEGAIEIAEMERKLAEQTRLLQRMSLHDGLTDLPNRNLFFDRLELKRKESERRDESFAVMMMDLDDFKGINDRLGHDAGDQVLRAVAQRLAHVTRGSDTVARLGGDEFAGIFELGESLDDVAAVAEKICRAVAEPMVVQGEIISVALSLGAAVFPDSGENAAALLRSADAAMYAAKRSGVGYAIDGVEHGPTDFSKHRRQ